MAARQATDDGNSSTVSSGARFHHANKAGLTVVEVEGDLEDEDQEAFRAAVLQSMSVLENGEDIALDFSGVTFLSEGALAALIHLLKAQRTRGGALRLIHPSPYVRKKLERMAPLKFFPVDEP